MSKKQFKDIEAGTEELPMSIKEAKEFGLSIRSEDIGYDIDDADDPYN